MCGVKTNVITAIEVTHAHASDHNYFEPLVETTSQNFVMDSVTADKAYSSYRNTQFTLSKAAMPYIDFKKQDERQGSVGMASHVPLLFLQPRGIHAPLPQAQQCRNHIPHDQG
jgi:hypothetical protein